MKPLLSASIVSAAITTSGCGFMSPAKDPDSLTVQVPLEQTLPAPKQAKTESPVSTKVSIEDQLIDSARRDLSKVCTDLENGNIQCSGEVFRNITADDADAEQIRVFQNRCLALMAECEQNSAGFSRDR